jgi:SAM-dependent methyltransferase
MSLDEHRHYLADRPRLDAYRRALRAVVRAGDVVLDLGCGTGILGFLACEAGASHVYAVDEGPIIEVARQFAGANGLADRVTFLRGHSTRLELPERVDVVVCDQIGNLGIEAGIFECLLDARRRLTRADARFVPSRLTFMAAPVESQAFRSRLQLWSTQPAGFEVGQGRTLALNTCYADTLDARQWLSAPAALLASPLPPPDLAAVRGRADFSCTRDGVIDGVSMWFCADLARGVRMTNEPGHAERIDRGQVLLPVEAPTRVAAGDRVAVEVSMLPAEGILNWTVSVTSVDGGVVAAFRHSSFKGILLAHEELARTDPQAVPELSPAGAVQRSILELCDGRRTLAQIEAEVFARHRDVLAGRDEAATLVAGVLARYGAASHAVLSDR